MENTPLPALQNIPLHLVSQFLSHLDSIEDLASAVLSHHVFNFAFQDNQAQTVQSIIARQISDDLLSYAIALSECEEVATEDADSARSLLTRLHEQIKSPIEAVSSLSSISLKRLKIISQRHAIIQCMAQDLASEMIPLLNHKLGVSHPDNISLCESFRICRAFYRYLIMCSLFGRRADLQISEEDRHELLFNSFSPWVNEQLICVYTYLQQKVCLAFDDVAAHDVDYGGVPVEWNSEPEDIDRLQEFLAEDVELLFKITRSTSFDERIKLMPVSKFQGLGYNSNPTCLLDSLTVDTFWRDLQIGTGFPVDGFDGLVSTNRDWLESQSYPSDGKHDGLDSGSFNLWYSAHLSCEILENEVLEATYCDYDKNLWEFGYTFWDCDEFEESRMAQMFDKTRRAPAFFFREYNWTPNTISESQSQRSDILTWGGSGYWVPGQFDFSRIHGLRESDKEHLIYNWQVQRVDRALSYED